MKKKQARRLLKFAKCLTEAVNEAERFDEYLMEQDEGKKALEKTVKSLRRDLDTMKRAYNTVQYRYSTLRRILGKQPLYTRELVTGATAEESGLIHTEFQVPSGEELDPPGTQQGGSDEPKEQEPKADDGEAGDEGSTEPLAPLEPAEVIQRFLNAGGSDG